MAVKDRILIGSLDDAAAVFSGKDIISLSGVKAVDIVGSQLSVDRLTAVVQYPYCKDSVEFIAPKDYERVETSDGYLLASNRAFINIRDLAFGTSLFHSESERVIEKMYIRNVERVAREQYKINAMSGIGLLDIQMHYGNIYRGEFFSDVLADIIGGAFEYTVADELAALQVYGYLPYAVRRKNLHQLVFSSGVMVAKDDNGDPLFKYLSSRNIKQIPDGRIYMGGSVDYSDPASAVKVTEHSYMELPTDETVVEYDNTDGSETADHTFLAFRNAPLHDLEVTGSLVIEDSGVNWAIISGSGTLSGKKYTHSTRVMTRYAENAANQKENVKTVSDCTLITVANSQNVAARVMSYYSSKKTVSAAIVVDGEKPGDLVAGKDPYKEEIVGFITSMETTVSNTNKANCRIITGYTPGGDGNNYTRSRILTGSGNLNWDELLADKDDDDVVQISLGAGGHGGEPGSPGGAGTNPVSGWSSYEDGTPGEGGAGGAPGSGGKVLTFTMKVSELRGLVSAYNCGDGGESGSDGGETTMMGRSSEEGAILPYGLINIFTGEILAKAGTDRGHPGGSGSGRTTTGEAVTYNGNTWRPGGNGTASEGSDSWSYGRVRHEVTSYGQGGYGGGAAVGFNGGDGANSTDGFPGHGGDGASPGARAAATGLGEGGPGGHGGGGSGVGGLGTRRDVQYIDGEHDSTFDDYTAASNGTPGEGGPGGRGGPGFIQIYY